MPSRFVNEDILSMSEGKLWDTRAVLEVWDSLEDNGLHDQWDRLERFLFLQIASVVADISQLRWNCHTLKE